MKKIAMMVIVALLWANAVNSADVTAIKAIVGGKDVRFIYDKFVSGGNFFETRTKYKIYSLDTRDNIEKQISPGGMSTEQAYNDIFFLHGGNQFAYSICDATNKTYVADYNGSNNREICSGQITSVAYINGIQWLYVQKVAQGSIYRVNAANSSQSETVYNGTVGRGGDGATFQSWFRVSTDGLRATAPDPGSVGIVTLPCASNCSIANLTGGCGPAMAPDAARHWFVTQPGHDRAFVYSGDTKASIGTLSYTSVTGGSAWFIKWPSYDASVNVVTMSGPGTGGVDNTGNNPDLYIASMNSNWTSFGSKAKINTGTGSRYFWSDLYVGDLGTLAQSVSAPVIIPAIITFTDSVSVAISSETSGSTIHYTTNGTIPTTASSVYATSFVIKQTTTVQAIAVKTAMTKSPVTTVTYTKTALATPSISPHGGAFTDSVKVTLSGSDTLYYTLDGSDPVKTSTKYSSPFWVKLSYTLKVRSIAGSVISPVAMATFTVNVTNPIVLTAPNGGESFKVGQTMNIKWTTQGVNSVLVFLSVDNGKNYYNITYQELPVAIGTTQWVNYPFVIPATINKNGSDVSLVSNSAKVKLVDYTDPLKSDESNASFIIGPATSGIVKPSVLNTAAPATLLDAALYTLSGKLVAQIRGISSYCTWVPGVTQGMYIMRIGSVSGEVNSRISLNGVKARVSFK